jgi:uncharacterized membrane protein YcaP (DUF421 family)
MAEVFSIILCSTASILTLFVLTKLMGYRQMSQLSMFDYINGITIGSIAAEMATSLDESILQPFLAMIVYSLFAILLSFLSSKSIRMRRIVEGKPLVLMSDGEIFESNLKKAKIDLSEFLVQCRVNGYFDVSKLEAAILEGNGRISFLPKSDDRPLTVSDVHLSVPKDDPVAVVILDGCLMKQNLKHTGRDETWLLHQIQAQGTKRVADVLLATCDRFGAVTVFPKHTAAKAVDILA